MNQRGAQGLNNKQPLIALSFTSLIYMAPLFLSFPFLFFLLLQVVAATFARGADPRLVMEIHLFSTQVHISLAAGESDRRDSEGYKLVGWK